MTCANVGGANPFVCVCVCVCVCAFVCMYACVCGQGVIFYRGVASGVTSVLHLPIMLGARKQ